MTKTLKELIKDKKECYASCSDYSCVRSGGCTGDASYKLSEYYSIQRRKQEEDAKYKSFKALMDRYKKENAG